MRKHHHLPPISTLLAAVVLTANQGLRAGPESTTADSGPQTRIDTTAAETVATGAVVDRLSLEFADFLGGAQPARDVIIQLREHGLQPPETEPVADATASTTESVRTLGYGEIRHALKLARAELDKLGISQPSDTELNAILYGGEIGGTQVNGMLALRAAGMGWGRIARAHGYKLGTVVGDGHGKSVAAVEAPAAATARMARRTVKASAAGGYIPSGGATAGHALGRGLVTAAGTRVVTLQAKAQSKALGHGKAGQGRLVRAAAGSSHGAIGLSSAGGTAASKAHGLAKGHDR